MERVKLNATLRQESGKTAARRLRKQGQIPAVVYGRGREPMNVAVPTEELRAALRGGGYATHLFDLDIPDTPPVTVMIADVQSNPISRILLNVDLHAISLTERVHANVPVILRGEPIGLKHGGVVERMYSEISVSALPTDIPDHFEVDISGLGIGDAIHVSDLPMPEGAQALLSLDEAIVRLASPTKAIEETPVAAEETAEPELVTKRGESED
jgi:large subunit ribosomal protein L25